jgi:type I restriction enzyme S subunit
MYPVKKLQDCATIIAGQSPESKYYNTVGDGIPFFQGKADFGELYPSARVYCTNPTKIAQYNDILLSVRAPVGPTNLSPGKVCIGRGLAAIRPDSSLNLKYLLYYFRYFESQLSSKGTGTTFKAITQKTIKNLDVPAPPMEEQVKIVARIDELFSELDKAVDTLNTTKEQLAVYRQAVLKDAFSCLPETVEMDKIADMIDPQPSHRTPPECKNGIPYIGIGDIDYQNKKINFEDARKVSPEILDEHLHRYTIHKGDFVMGKIGTIGKPYKIPDEQNYALSANVILIQPNKEKICPEFLFWQFSSSLVTKQLTLGAKATSQPAFGIKKARLLSIKICELEKQFKIIKRLEAEMSCCDNIEKTVDTALAQADAMRQSILKQAFEEGIV